MKSLSKLFFLFILFLFVSSCDNINENPVSSERGNGRLSNAVVANYTLSMMVTQNGQYQSFLLYDNGVGFSLFGTFNDSFFTRKDPNSTYEVTCTYSWTGNTSSDIAGQFHIYNATDNFSWYSPYFFANGNSGSITETYTNVNLSNGKIYDVQMVNSVFTDEE